MAVGGVVAFREAMNLFVDTAETKGVPDFARFDCASCHHDLRISADSFRQKRKYESLAPGRPPAAKWPTQLLWLAIEAGDRDRIEARKQELQTGLNALHQAISDRPFGTKESVLTAKSLSTWADGLIKELDAKKLTSTEALRMLHEIATMNPPDHASARQLVWGFKAIYDELDPKPANDKELQSVLNALIDCLKIRLKPGDKNIHQPGPRRSSGRRRLVRPRNHRQEPS